MIDQILCIRGNKYGFIRTYFINKAPQVKVTEHYTILSSAIEDRTVTTVDLF